VSSFSSLTIGELTKRQRHLPSKNADEKHRYQEVDVPTLILHGDDDQIVPIGASALLSSKLVFVLALFIVLTIAAAIKFRIE
jgi:pimeloyl-ACP methyl ester carboxylesterase